MGNSLIEDTKSVISNKEKNQLVLNDKLNHNLSQKLLPEKFNNKKSDLDLFKKTENYIKQNPKKGNEIKHISSIKIKNKFINEENNNNFLRTINNNPIKKIKNQMHRNINTEIIKEDIELESNLNSNLISEEHKKDEREQNTIKVNQNLYEFEINNDKYFHYKDEKNKNKFLQKTDDIVTSERTINNTNDGEFGEFFFDNNHKKVKAKNSKNIFGNISKYNFPKNTNNLKNKDKTGTEELINAKKLKNNINKNKSLKNSDIKMKINNIKYRKTKAKSKQDNHKKDNSIIKVHHANNNNLLLISSFLTNSKTYSRNKKNKSETSYNNNNTFLENENNSNKNIIKNFSLKNISNNIICIKKQNINSYKEQKLNLKKIKNKRNVKTKKISSSNYSYNYNNFYICNNDYNNSINSNNLYERKKMAELIKKIPNNELKNEIMSLYQKIVNYNKEIIINDKNGSFDYIITFSNNYIKIDEKVFIRKELNQNNLKMKNEIIITLINNKQNKVRNKSCNEKEKPKNNNINIIKNVNNKINTKTNNQKLKQNNKKNYIINNPNNNKESIFKQYTFKQYKKYESENNHFKNSKKHFELSQTDLGSKLRTINQKNDSSQNNEKEKCKIEINSVNPKIWRKIINLNEVTINKEKILPFTVIEKNNTTLIKEIITKDNENYINKDLCKENELRNHSANIKPKNEKNNNKNKTSKSIDAIKIKDNQNKYDKFYTYNLGREKIIYQKNLKKLIKVKNLLNDIKKYQKNFVFKEEDLIMINAICFISLNYIIIFKDKEKKYPMFKRKLDLIKSVMSFKKNCKFIVIIEFGKSKNENYEKDKYLGLLIDNEKNYNELIGLFSQLIHDLEIIFLN